MSIGRKTRKPVAAARATPRAIDNTKSDMRGRTYNESAAAAPAGVVCNKTQLSGCKLSALAHAGAEKLIQSSTRPGFPEPTRNFVDKSTILTRSYVEGALDELEYTPKVLIEVLHPSSQMEQKKLFGGHFGLRIKCASGSYAPHLP